MLSVFLHRRRVAAKALEAAHGAGESAGAAVERNRQIFGTRLLVRGLLWASIYLLSRGLLELGIEPAAARVGIALLPTPFFVWWLWTWMKGVAQMDELERRIELEALGFAFPVAVIFLATLGLLDLAVTLNPNDFSLRHTWLMLPILYYIGLALARRRYQ